MKKTVDKRVKRTKKAFQCTLLALLKEKCFEDITITEIVKKADYNRGTFYIHYEQKEDLLQEMMDEKLDELRFAFRKPYQHLTDEVNIRELSTTCLFDHFLINRDFYQTMLSSRVSINFQEEMVRSLEKHFKEDIDFTSNHVPNDINLKLFYHYRVYGIIGLIIEWIRSDFQHSKSYMAEQVVKIATFHTKKVSIKSN
ncbi:TetR/AcrR family transcriptional regulator [Oceanobacillus senegalensis]|uniref:TetR/AcrR family transcriptional regulator n=1 Tax=Oceanobacillus senegalensis TaxID=1936063 RepID=UPI000A3056E1|nr:TetR/AcrR family transcriptional regulator [Oceanobacillus senegalensis]